MNAQLIQDIAVLGGMFFLRLGLPVLIVLGTGVLLRRWLEPKATREQFEGIIRSAQENATTDAEAKSNR